MPLLTKRMEKQRTLVRRMRAQLAFETLVLSRLESRLRPAAPDLQSLGTVLSNARRRQLQPELEG